MTFWLLAGLVVVDGAFCGFRCAAGRNPRIFIRSYYARSIIRGVALSLLTTVVFLAVASAAEGWFGPAVWSALDRGAASMLQVYGVYATLVVVALVVFAIGPFELSVLATVLVLGPFTLIRPMVIAAGWIYLATNTEDLFVMGYGLAAAAVMMVFEPLLTLGRPPWQDVLPRVPTRASPSTRRA